MLTAALKGSILQHLVIIVYSVDYQGIDGMIRALSAGDLGGVAARLCNVFEEFLPEEYHEVFHIKNRLLELGALNAAMSGSGPTVFGIFREETAAKAALTALKQRYPQTYLAKPVGKLV